MEKMIIVGSDTPVCDFCSQPGVKWSAHSTPAEMHVATAKKSTSLNSDAEWAVCDTCLPFLQANDHEGLAQRSHETDPMPGEELIDPKTPCFHRSLQEGLFWPGFKGLIVAVDPNERMVVRYVKVDGLDASAVARIFKVDDDD